MVDFQRKIKPPTPPCMDEDSQGAASDEGNAPRAPLLSSDDSEEELKEDKPITKTKKEIPVWTSSDSGNSSLSNQCMSFFYYFIPIV